MNRYAELISGFHYQDGWYFQRLDDGSVRVLKRSCFIGKEYQCEAQEVMVIRPKPWASINASVSVDGETAGRFYQALEYHMGTTDV